MRLLELFSGTGSIGNVFKERGWEVVSLDKDMPADIQMDILNWDYRNAPYQPKHFDVIWASPPCTEYSRAKTVGIRQLEFANRIVQRTLDIIHYFDPEIYFLENPQTGLLKNQPFMQALPYNDTDYCKYGMRYRKRTRLWNNSIHFFPKLCHRDCDAMNERRSRHEETAQQGVNTHSRVRHRLRELYVVPRALVEEIVAAVTADLSE